MATNFFGGDFFGGEFFNGTPDVRATPGRFPFQGLTGHGYIREERKVEVRTVTQDAEFNRESERLAVALAEIEDERRALLSSIASLEGLHTARAERRTLLRRQALQLADAKAALVREEMEVLDVVCCAVAAMNMH